MTKIKITQKGLDLMKQKDYYEIVKLFILLGMKENNVYDSDIMREKLQGCDYDECIISLIDNGCIVKM